MSYLSSDLSKMVISSVLLRQGTSYLASFAGYMTEESIHLIDSSNENSSSLWNEISTPEREMKLYHTWIGRYIEAWAPKTTNRLEIFRLYVERSLASWTEPSIGEHFITEGKEGLFDWRISIDHLWGDYLVEMSIDKLKERYNKSLSFETSSIPLCPRNYIPASWVPHPRIFPDYALIETRKTGLCPKTQIQ